MTIKAQVLDNSNGQPVPYASVTIIDQDGNDTGVGTTTDSNGNFSLSSSLLNGVDHWVRISSIGYDPGEFPPAKFGGYSDVKINLDPNAQSTGLDVVITAKKKTPVTKPSYVVAAALCGAALVTIGIYFYIK